MELRGYLAVVRKYWLSILIFTIAGGLVAGIYVLVTKPTYTARAEIFLSMQSAGSVSDLVSGASYVTTQARSFAQITTTPKVLDPVIGKLNLDTTPAQLAKAVTVTIPTNTSIIQISVDERDAGLAARLAEAIAQQLVPVVAQLSPKDTSQNNTIVASIITDAVVPTSPTSPNIPLSLALGIIAGLVVGVAQAVLRKVLDLTIRTDEDVKSVTDHSIIATIPLSRDVAKAPLVVYGAPQSSAAEEFRRLRTNLQFLALGSTQRKVFLITSSTVGEGKSTTAINVGSALAEVGERVLLVDADLRRPALGKYLNVEGAVGLTTVLLGRAELSDVIQSLGPGAPDVLPLGQVPPNPAELAGSREMWSVIDQVSHKYDTVIIDSAPLCPVTDTAILSAFTTGAIVVVASGKVKRPQLQQAIESLDHISTPVMGIVLNQVHGRERKDPYYYYYGDRTSRSSKGRTSKGRTSRPPKDRASGATQGSGRATPAPTPGGEASARPPVSRTDRAKRSR